MSTEQYIIQCLRPNCRFRYLSPQQESSQFACVKCGSATKISPFFIENLPGRNQAAKNSHHLEILCDNIRSANNLGSIFRTSDGAGVRHIHVGGITPAPDHPNVQKTALGAEKIVPWTQTWNAYETALELKSRNFTLYALENSQESISLFELDHFPGSPVLLIVGNEVNGIDPGILEISNQHISIPMLGVKNSLNVSVAFGIAAYSLMFLPSLGTP